MLPGRAKDEHREERPKGALQGELFALPLWAVQFATDIIEHAEGGMMSVIDVQ